jgi:alpha-1,2-mannosyltransferase
VTWLVVSVFAVLAVVVALWHIFVLPITDNHYGIFDNYADLQIYRAGGQAVIDGSRLYDGPVLWGMQWTYSPFAALLMVPFAVTEQLTANVIWWAGTYLALVAVVALSFKSLGYRFTRRLLILCVLLAFVVTSFEPVRDTIWLGQINVYLMLLVLWDLVRTSNSRFRGFGVGIAAGIKLTPLLFLVYLAVTRQWRACLHGVGGFLTTVVIGFVVVPHDSWTYWTGRFIDADNVGGVDAPANQSINGFFAQMFRFLDVTRYLNVDNGAFEPPIWLWLAFAVPALAVGLWAASIAHRRHQELLAVVLAAMTASAISPFSWGHHWVWFVPLFVLALHHALTSRTWWRWMVPISLAVPAFAWWHNYWDSGLWRGSDHVIGIGLFMMPRPADPAWWHHLAVPIYAGCFPSVFAVTAVAVIVVGRCRPDVD